MKNALLCLIIVSLSACGGGISELTLKEAEKITLHYQGENYTPPPRSIDGIVKKILAADEGKIRRRGYICRMCPSMDVNDPDTEIRMSNLSKLGITAHKRGNSKRAVEYLRKAYELLQHEDIKRKYSSYNRTHFDHEYFSVLHRNAKVSMESGRFSDGVRYMREAEELNLKKDKPRKGKSVQHTTYLARAYAELGDIETAQEMLDEAKEMHDRMGFNSERSQKRRIIHSIRRAIAEGKVAEAKGDLREAEQHYRHASTLLNDLVGGLRGQIFTNRAKVRGNYLVKNLLAQGRVAEAEAQVVDGLESTLDTFGRDNHVTAKVLQAYVEVLMARGRNGDARKIIKLTKNIYNTIGATKDSYEKAKLYLLLANIYIAESDWDNALKVFQYVYSSLSTDPEARKGLFSANLNWAIALANTNQYNNAETVAKNAADKYTDIYGEYHFYTAEAQAVIAMIYARQGHTRRARQLYKKVLPILVSENNSMHVSRANSGAENQRLRSVLETYLSILSDKAKQGNVQAIEQAFHVVQLIQGKEVQAAVASSAARASIDNPELVYLSRKEQDTLQKIEAGYNQLGITRSAENNSQELFKTIKTRVNKLEKAHQAILADIRNRFPEYDELIRPKPVALKEASANLTTGEVLLMIYSGEENTYVWSVMKGNRVFLKRVNINRRQVADMVSAIRKGLDLQARNISSIPEFDVARASQLYRQLLASSAGEWGNAKQLVIVTDGALSRLPFSVLVTKKSASLRKGRLAFSEYRNVDWLANNYTTSYTPSVSTLVRLRSLNIKTPPKVQFAGFGDPVFGTGKNNSIPKTVLKSRGIQISMRGLRRLNKGEMNTQNKKASNATLSNLVNLPETADEVLQVANTLGVKPNGNVFLGNRANEQQVKSMSLVNRRVVMFATHALLPGDLDGLVQPAIALSTSGKEDGLLTMGEIMGLKLNADWVVLSACNTGAGSGRGADAVSGLGQAFFYAGSRSLLISHWPVETTSAKQITTGLFAKQSSDKNISRATALTDTMRDLIQNRSYKNVQGKELFTYAHPVFWAPFTVVGDGAGKRAN